MSGSHCAKQVISFNKLKLTNNPFDKFGHIILNSMHKYVPRLHIVTQDLKTAHTYILNEAVFTAVTAYQSESVTKLKIEFNPFAKGFRNGEQSRKFVAIIWFYKFFFIIKLTSYIIYKRNKRSSDEENEPLFDQRSYNQMILNIQNKTGREISNPLIGKGRVNSQELEPGQVVYHNQFQHQPNHHQESYAHVPNKQFVSNSDTTSPLKQIDENTKTITNRNLNSNFIY